MTEAHKTPEAETKKEALTEEQVDALLNNDSFRQFLEQFPDAEQVVRTNNLDRYQEIHEIFEKKEGVARELRDLFKGDIKKEIGMDVDDSVLEDVHTFVEGIAVSNPEQFKALSADLEQTKVNQAEHDRLAGILAQYDDKAIQGKEAAVSIAEEKLETAKAAQATTLPKAEWGRAIHKILHFGNVENHWTEPIRDKARNWGLTGMQIDNEALTKIIEETKSEIATKKSDAHYTKEMVALAKTKIAEMEGFKKELLKVGDLTDKIALNIQQKMAKKFAEMLETPRYDEIIGANKTKIEENKLTIEGNTTAITLRENSLPTLEANLKQKQEDKKQQQAVLQQLNAGRDLAAQKEAGRNLQQINADILQIEKDLKTAKEDIEKYKKDNAVLEEETKKLEKSTKDTHNTREQAVLNSQNTFNKINAEESWQSPYLQYFSVEEMQDIGHHIESNLRDSLEYAVENVTLGRKGLEDMDKAIGKFLEMKKMGMLEKEDVKKFFIETLSGITKNLPDKDPKRVFINRLMFKYFNN